MKVLIVHNRYQIAGGEDAVVAQESAMLQSAGVVVENFQVDNDGLTSITSQIRASVEAVYSWSIRAKIRELCLKFQADIVHVHNFFPRITPSVYDAAHDAGALVVQTLHNYRLFCLNASLFRDGHVCEECVGKAVPWPGIIHACYRESRAGSAVVAAMLSLNRARSAWTERVDRYVVLTEFAKDFLVRNAGISKAKVSLKPNATMDFGIGLGTGGYALYAGRLSAEKGITQLIEAAHLGLGMPLLVAGTGPLEAEVRRAADAGLILYLGQKSQSEVHMLMRDAKVLMLPSQWYEGLPMVMVEAYATGLPVIAPNLGSLATLIIDGQTGLLVPIDSPTAMALAARRIADDAALSMQLRAGARKTFVELYHPKVNVQRLLEIYNEALRTARSN